MEGQNTGTFSLSFSCRFQLILFTIIINFLSETVDMGVCIYFGFKPHLIFLNVKRNVIKAVFSLFPEAIVMLHAW